jgi:hypothetical protein
MTPPKPPLPRRTPRRGTLAPTTGEHALRAEPAGTARVREAVEARDALAVALSTAGIQLPATDSPAPSPAMDSDSGRASRHALVYLGVCSAPVALALAAVIVKGAGR